MLTVSSRASEINRACEICGEVTWSIVHSGLVRNGHIKHPKIDGCIVECQSCGVWRLCEEFCIPDTFYESGEYRSLVDQTLAEPDAFSTQDDLAFQTACAFNSIGGLANLRNASVLDVGCGVGSLLDLCANIAMTTAGIEPCQPYHPLLISRGHMVFENLEAAKAAAPGSFDWSFCIQVIEHVSDPVSFLSAIGELLTPKSQLVLTTPNRDDLLVSLLPEYKEFFFRTQHRWYFNAESLAYCANLAGFSTESVHFTQKYPLGNFVNWLKDRKPTGMAAVAGIDSDSDALWKLLLERNRCSDTLIAVLRKS